MAIVFIYVCAGLAVAVGAFGQGWLPGLSALGTTGLSVIAGGGLKGSIFAWRALPEEHPFRQKVLGVVLTVVCLGLSLWIGRAFVVQFVGHQISGSIHGLIGAVISLLFVPGRFALTQEEWSRSADRLPP
jgi:hypothetical protein